VIVKALNDPRVRGLARWRVLGARGALEGAARGAGVEPFWDRGDCELLESEVRDARYERGASAAGGELSFRWVDEAIAMARRPSGDSLRVDAVVTAPISKRAWELAGHGAFPGHTELFATRLGATRHGMMFVSPRLRVILATAHVPLMRVRETLSTARVLEVIELGAEACRALGVARPRLAVCGLNPHAGESGLLGADESEVIEPAIRAAVAAGIDAQGPFPGDTVFIAAAAGRWDLVVAMHHDQGLIPVKLLDRDRAVNVTVGLPIVRTSPDHGTAFDIAGQNKADPGSMIAAMELAARMAAGR
jgi:4-hydroxythreonine-4-phosphate dehydrogenase